jgi:putative two-component system response regulator
MGLERPTSAVILVVDDVETNLRLLERLLVAEGHIVLTAHDGQEALDTIAQTAPDVVVMDVRMPQLDGFAACERLKAEDRTRLIPVVLMTGSAEREDRVRAIEAGADDFLTKPVDESELKARVRSLVRIKRYTDELDSAESVILSLALTVEARDPYTQGHCQRLARYAGTLGRRLGLPAEELEALHRGGYLHDVGKIATPDAILLKPGPLTPDELHVMREHPLVGDRLCGDLRVLTRVRPIVRSHHERLDGSGYPDGLVGRNVPLLAQIIAVVDVYDAMTTWRPYKGPVSVERAYEELDKESVRGWRDADLVKEFIAAGRAGELGEPPKLGPPAALGRTGRA